MVLFAALPLTSAGATVTPDPASDPSQDPASTATTTIAPILTSKDVKVTYKVNTKDKVVFITIDDGFHVSPELARIIR